MHLPHRLLLPVMRRPLFSLVEPAMRLCHCRNFTHSRCHQHTIIYITTTNHLICIISRQVTNKMASIETLFSCPLFTPKPSLNPSIQPAHNATPARPISAGLPWATAKADARCSLAARSRLARSSKPALGELQCSCCMICATPPAPPPTHHHHSLSHPSICIHSHCKPSCSRYYHFSRPHTLFPVSDQSLSKIATPPIARPPSRHPPCSSCYQTPSSLQTALLPFPSAHNH